MLLWTYGRNQVAVKPEGLVSFIVKPVGLGLLPLGIVKASFSSAINFVDFSFARCKSSNMFGFYSLN